MGVSQGLSDVLAGEEGHFLGSFIPGLRGSWAALCALRHPCRVLGLDLYSSPEAPGNGEIPAFLQVKDSCDVKSTNNTGSEMSRCKKTMESVLKQVFVCTRPVFLGAVRSFWPGIRARMMLSSGEWMWLMCKVKGITQEPCVLLELLNCCCRDGSILETGTPK